MQIVTFIAGLLILFVGLIIAVVWNQRRIMYPGWLLGGGDLKHQDVHVWNDGGHHAALVSLPENKDAPVVVFFHGNGCTLSVVTNVMLPKFRLKYPNIGFCAIEYVGYGVLQDQGCPSFQSIVTGVKATMALIHKKFDLDLYERGIFIGHSLGCSVAMQVLIDAGKGCKGLAFLAPFSSMHHVVVSKLPAPVGWIVSKCPFLVFDKIDNLASARKLKDTPFPKIICGCRFDEIVPCEQSELLAKEIGCELRLIDSNHTRVDISDVYDWLDGIL